MLKGVWQCKFKGQLDRLSEMSDKVRPVCRLLLTSAPPPNVLNLLLHSNTERQSVCDAKTYLLKGFGSGP